MLGNKADLGDGREVSPEAVRSKIEETGLPYFEISAKTGHNIKEAFHFAGNEYFNLHMNNTELTLSTICHEKTRQ